jgi:hypothetical protein
MTTPSAQRRRARNRGVQATGGGTRNRLTSVDSRALSSGKRLSHQPPSVIAKLGWRYHHIGIPHTRPREHEQYVARLGVHVAGFETSPYGIEWIRFEPQCDVPEIVRLVPHIAFAVDDLDEALRGREILISPNEPSPGVRVAFILDDGAPVELLQFHGARSKEIHRRRKG